MAIPPTTNKLETLTLTKPDTPRLPIDHSALEELHLGPIPCIRVREAPDAQLDPSHRPGTAKQFHGMLTVLNIPKGFYRIDSATWDEVMTSGYGEKRSDGSLQETPLVDLTQNSHFFFWLYDLKPGPAPDDKQFSTAALDFCEDLQPDDNNLVKLTGQFWDGRDNACDRVFFTGGAKTPFVCEYRYYPNTIYKTDLRDILRDKYFNRTPKLATGTPTNADIQGRSQDSVKMLATMIPGRGVVWLPLVTGKETIAAYNALLAGQTAVVYRLQFLDGPNILIGKLEDTPW